MERGDVAKAIECYMNEYNASQEDGREHLQSMIWATWKKLNEEATNSSFPKDFTDICVNLGRTALWCYRHGDGYADQDPETNNNVLSLIIEPIPSV